MSRLGRVLAAFAVAASALFAAGCATGPSTTVVLLPDEDGHVGAVVVAGVQGAGQRIGSAYGATTVRRGAAAPAASPPLQRGVVESRYDDLLKAQPSRPETFTLNFLLDTTTLTDASRDLLPRVIDAARRRRPTEISIFGHADSTGSERHNDRLSAERARVVAALLRKADPAIGDIDIQSFGDRVPLVPSDGRNPEPRNRRVEIQIL